jgi:hypothetical protein
MWFIPVFGDFAVGSGVERARVINRVILTRIPLVTGLEDLDDVIGISGIGSCTKISIRNNLALRGATYGVSIIASSFVIAGICPSKVTVWTLRTVWNLALAV